MNHFPPLWIESAEAAVLWPQLQSAPRSLLMLDYDGTLAPFRDDRFEATPYPGVEDRLAILSGLSRVRLVLITGRSARDLKDLLPPTVELEIWGSHGRERLNVDGSYELAALDPLQLDALQEVGQQLSGLGYAAALEMKPASLAVHWRGLEPEAKERLRSLTYSVFERLIPASGLQLLPFDGGLELRSPDRTKGTAVRQILAQEPAALPVVYLGDDLTDEDAFAEVGNRGASILVRPVARESSAGFWLRPPQELLDFLDSWIEATTEPLKHAPAPSAEASP
jgi:trehalose-phosphatase